MSSSKKKVKSAERASAKAERDRSKKEVISKLDNLTTLARAEVINDALNKQVTKHVGGFAEFMREQGVIGIGIGLVLGVQIKAVVDSIMNSFVNPITSLFLPGQEALSQKVVELHIDSRTAVIGWGAIVYSLFSFIMVATIIYILYK